MFWPKVFSSIQPHTFLGEQTTELILRFMVWNFPPHDLLLEIKKLKCFLHMTAISGGLEAILNPFKPNLASLYKITSFFAKNEKVQFCPVWVGWWLWWLCRAKILSFGRIWSHSGKFLLWKSSIFGPFWCFQLKSSEANLPGCVFVKSLFHFKIWILDEFWAIRCNKIISKSNKIPS